jgi:hypothetical protein
MNKLTKIALAVLTSFSVTAISVAGEFTVTGAAKATYSVSSSDSDSAQNNGNKGIGIANEFSLGASGELDNGMTWSYAQDIDGATVQDDAKMTLTTDYGTIGVFVSEGSLSTKYGFDASAYGAPSDYGTASRSTVVHTNGLKGASFTYGNNISGYNNLQYHTPSGLLPLSTSIKVAYAPTSQVNANASSNATGAKTSETNMGAQEVKLTTTPVDGLDLGVSYFKTNDSAQSFTAQNYEAGGYTAKYATGNFTVGYGRHYVAPQIAAQAAAVQYAQDYTNDAYSIGYVVNDSLSISYTVEKSDANMQTIQEGANTQEAVETKITGIQAAYTMGGMTISLANKEIEDANYTANVDIGETVVAVVMAF